MTAYRLKAGDRRSIALGEAIELEDRSRQAVTGAVSQAEEDRWDWHLPEGVYRAEDIVRELGALLESIRINLGGDGVGEALLRNVEASLALSGRESIVPLGALALEDSSRSEIAAQAARIGGALAGWARAYDADRHARKKYGERVLGGLRFRSRCDNHLWTHEVTALLQGPGGNPTVMQLFNEYLHQIVLLREALLPFENWRDVPIEIRDRGAGKGLRYMENARAAFLAELTVRKLPHASVVRLAQALLSPELDHVGYGFQYRLGSVLPASLGRTSAEAPRYLLRWHPALIVPEARARPVSFAYAADDYYSEPRSRIGTETARENERADLASSEASVVATAERPDRVVLRYRLEIGTEPCEVDLGQTFRGHRYHYRPSPAASPASAGVAAPPDVRVHRTEDVLRSPGLVTDEDGVHLIDARGNPLARWALLGKLYPENVVLLDGDSAEELLAAHAAGKGFGTKFLVR